jgi:hypothetical protein
MECQNEDLKGDGRGDSQRRESRVKAIQNKCTLCLLGLHDEVIHVY